MIETIRISQRAKEQLIWLKRQTGITQWNVLCRWALCLSLADPSPIGDFDDAADSNVEMRWEVFAGEFNSIYLCTIIERAKNEFSTINLKNITSSTRRHIHRGIMKLSGAHDISKIINTVPKNHV
ncbi:MAG: DNA sulfur modification protein DndE [Desulfovibrionaceae bacterium]|nr:DNA sulfur modification protein DndE [Desulfovibrionaceae bacterium]